MRSVSCSLVKLGRYERFGVGLGLGYGLGFFWDRSLVLVSGRELGLVKEVARARIYGRGKFVFLSFGWRF